MTQFPGAFASVSALVNCAGIIIHDAKEFTPSAVGKVIHVNLLVTNLMTLALRPMLACHVRRAVTTSKATRSGRAEERRDAHCLRPDQRFAQFDQLDLQTADDVVADLPYRDFLA